MKKFLILMTCLVLSACAERYREADSGRSASEVEGLVAELRSRGTLNDSGNGAAALDLAGQQKAVIYFAESNNSGKAPMGPIHTVTPLNFQDLGIDIYPSQIEYIRVYFLEALEESGRRDYALILDIKKIGDTTAQAYAFINDGQTNQEPEATVEEGLFRVSFPSANGETLYLESDDILDGGELGNVIQLKAYVLDQQGQEFSAGQISSLIGYF